MQNFYDSLIQIESFNQVSELEAKVGSGYLSGHSATMLKESLADCVQELILEYPYVDKDFRSTFYSDFSKRHRQIDRNSYRVHLFGENEKYFGFFTLRNTSPFNLGRGCIDPKALSTRPGHLLLTRFEVHLLGKTYTVDAFPWMQQDANISRCAQVSIWAIARYYSEKYPQYAEHTIQQIFELASSHTRKIPSKGLTTENISSIFSLIGFYPEIYFSEVVNDRKIFNEIIYIFIESGIPIVAGLREKRHAITVTGHLKIAPTKVVQHQIAPMSDLIQGYFSVDDNYPPYSVVGAEGKNSISDIDSIIVPLYEKMYLDVLTLLTRVLPQVERSFLPHNTMYRRVFMTSSKSFKRFIFDHIADETYRAQLLMLKMPKFIWVIEYFARDSYSDYVDSRFIFDATAMEYADLEKIMIAARIGKQFICNGASGKLNDDPEPIYVNNLREAGHGMDE